MRTEDDPQARVYEALMSVAFQQSPYRRPIIGWMNDLQNMSVDDARTWYWKWYSPGNATLTVVGDVEPEAVFSLARETFGKIPARTVPPRKPQPEPPQAGEKRIVVKAPSRLPYVLMSYHVPVIADPEKDWEPYALDMLTGVLDGGDAGRFTHDLIRGTRVAVEAGAGYDDVARGPGTLVLEGTPAEGKTAADLEAALRTEIAKVQSDGVSTEELDRVKAQLIASQVYQQDSMFYQAMLIGEFITAGLPVSAIETRVQKLKAVTPEQVQDVARRYLIADNLSVGVLDPQPIDAAKPAAHPVGGRHAR
jgi:zinc protease